jgi:cobalt/nickel transport protein
MIIASAVIALVSIFLFGNSMTRPYVPLLAVALLCLSKEPAAAHFNMLLLDKASMKKGDEVTLTYQWGHPYEHQLFDAPKPENLLVLAPDGKKTDLTKNLTKVDLAGNDNKAVSAYRVVFKAEQRGDYVFVLKTPPIWMEEEKEYLQDTVKVVLHVQTQKGWDSCGHEGLEIKPLTRPYGLQAGMVFQAEVRGPDKKGIEGLLVEVERYNPKPPSILPPDEQITRSAKTDASGVFTCTLTDPGWWCIAAAREGVSMERQGKKYPLRQRAIHWVFVDEKPGSKD